tara:strand:- start:1021 stop:1248 length:228 start_codon:yes stop_codon:yes gene_type:complete
MLDKKEQLVRVGSLVMWNRKSSNDYQCMGVVTHHYFEKQDYGESILEFTVLWADNDRVEYGYDDLWKEYVKVVKF